MVNIVKEVNIAELAYLSGYLADMRLQEIKEYNDLVNKFEELVSEVCSGMTKEQQHEMLLKIEDVYLGMESLGHTEYFKRGFKLGLTIGAQNFLD